MFLNQTLLKAIIMAQAVAGVYDDHIANYFVEYTQSYDYFAAESVCDARN